MPVRFVFHHLDPSRSLMRYTEEKLSHLFEKYFSRPPVAVRVSFTKLKNGRIAHCDFQGPYGKEVHTEVKAPTVYGAVNKMATRIGRQLRRQKERIKGHKSLPMHSVTAAEALAVEREESFPLV